MTLWNSLNVFSGQQRPVGSEPSASFDPSRTGDPLGPNAGRPAIGIGDARVGAAGSGDPRRHPIGFAPPEEQTSTTRYRTEISFKRHRELPRASATLDEAGTPQPSSTIEGAVAAEADAHDSVGSGEVSFDSVIERDEPRGDVEEAPVAEAAVPFYRREISFRRKRPTPDEVAAAAVSDEDDAVEEDVVDGDAVVLAQAEAHEEPDIAFEEPSAPDAPELVAVEETVVEEIVVEEIAGEETALEEAVVEETPVAEAAVPFYRREISFRRKRPTPDEVAAAAVSDEDDAVEEDVVDGDAVVLAQAEAHEEPDIAFEEPTASEAPEIVAVEEPTASEAPEIVAVEEPTASEAPEIVAVEAIVLDEAVGEEAAMAEAAIPFYKREISFRRKHPAPEEAAAAAVVAGAVESLDEPDAEAEVAAQADDHREPDAKVEEPAVPATDEATEFDEVTATVETLEVEAVASEPVGEVTATREAEDRAVEPTVEPGDDESAPVDEMDTGSVPVVAEATTEAAAEPVEDWPAVEDVEPLSADVVEEGPESDPAAVSDEAPVEDAPAPVEHISSRKQRNAEKKAARRKSGQGAKGRKVVGLKIGASQIAASVVSQTDAGYELLELARRPLAAGIVVDGEVRDEDSLALAVRALFDEEKLPRNDVRIGLSSNRIGVRSIDIPGAEDEARFDNAVRFKAHEVLPVALHESVLDYRVLEERSGEGGEQLRRVLLVVAPRDQVEPYQRMAGRAGINLTGIDLEALGLLRAFVEPKSGVAPKADDTAAVVVAIGHESSTLLVSGGGTCEFTRVFDWGGSALEEAVATALEVRPAEAATILRHLSLSGPGRQYESLDEVTRAKATEAVRLRLTPFARELVNSLQFYQTQAESLGIGGIVITGGTSHLEGLSDALHQMIGVDVSVGDPFARVIRTRDFDPAIEASIGSMAVSIGLAIDDDATRSVNLLPKGTVEKRSRRSTAIAIGAPVAAAVPLAALSILFLGAHGKAADRQAELDAVQAEIAALPEPSVPTIDAGVVGDEAVRATAVASVLGGRLAWEGVLSDMARVLPENVWLTTLSVAQPELTNLADGTGAVATPGQAAGPPNAVTFEGLTYTQPDVARLLARLATLPSLRRVTLTSSQSEVVGSNDVVRFVIVADLNQTGGAS